MKKEVKVSVIIPVYNVEEYLRKCLDSVVNQTLKEIEIICVDDGSTDSSLKILREYEKKDERVKVLTQKNMHAGVARNAGIAIATGRYFQFLDSDDFFELDMLENMYNQCEKESADVCLCAADRYNTVTGEFSPAGWYLNEKMTPDTVFSRKTLKDNIFRFCSPGPWNKMFSAKLIKDHELQFMNLQRSNDVYFVESALALANSITTVKKVFVHYRVSQTENLQSKNYLTPFCFCEALWELKKKLNLENILPEIYTAFVKLAFTTAVFNIESLKEHPDVQSKVIYAFKYLYSDLFGFSDKEMFKQFDSWNIKKWESWFGSNDNQEVAYPLYDKAKNPKVSVIIPVYNVEKYLSDCVFSVMKQTLSDIEIICVNDGSPDNSKEIVLNLMKVDKRIVLIDQENSGNSIARNQGMKAARGKYIIFIDSDDYIEPETLEVLYTRAEKDHLDILDYNARSFYESEQQMKDHMSFMTYYNRNGDYPDVYTGMELFSLMQEKHDVKPSPCLHLISREFYMNNSIFFYAGILHEDNEFSYQLIKNAKRVGYVPNVFYNRRVRGGSIMTVPKTTRNVYGYFISVFEILKDILNKNIDFSYSEALEGWLRNINNNIYNIYSNLEDKNMDTFFENNPELKILFDILFVDINRRIEKEKKALGKSNIHNSDVLALFEKNCHTARFEIKNTGTEKNDIEIISKSFKENVNEAKWMCNNTGKGYLIQTVDSSDELKLKCIGDGELRLSLRGPDFRNSKGERVPVKIAFTKLAVDEENVFSDIHTVWHDDPYIYKQKVKDGQVISLKIEWMSTSDAAKNLLEQKDKEIMELKNYLSVKDKDNEIAKIKNAVMLKEKEFKSSKSWKIGRFITFVPRKMKKLIHRGN